MRLRAIESATEGWKAQKTRPPPPETLSSPLCGAKTGPDGFGILPVEVAYRVVAAWWREFTSGFYAITG